MPIREDIESFPFDCRTKMTWLFLIDWDNKITTDFYNVSGKNDLVIKLREIIEKNTIDSYSLLGVWHGEYSTDLFLIPIPKAHAELSKYFNPSQE